MRAENWRTFRLTEEAPGVTKLDYVCSLNLGGSIPQAITNKVSVPTQMLGAHSPIGSRTLAYDICLSGRLCANRFLL